MKKRGNCLIALGVLLAVAAFFLTFYNVSEDKKASLESEKVVKLLEPLIFDAENGSSGQDNTDLAAGETYVPEYVLYPNMEMPTENVDGWEYIGIITIPALELELPVMSSWSYPGLNVAPCRYSGSAYSGDLCICAHNFPSHFGNLKDLHIGDELYFNDMAGNQFCYSVAELDVIKPDDVELMLSGDWDLSLFTCTIGGQSRICVRCESK